MPYFEHTVPLVSGTTVRAAPLNTIFSGIQTGFELLPANELSEKGFASTVFIQDAITADHAVNRRVLQNWPTFSIAVVDLGSNRFINALDPVDDQDLVTKAWSVANHGNSLADANAAAASAAEALVSENNAAASALLFNDVANHFYRN